MPKSKVVSGARAVKRTTTNVIGKWGFLIGIVIAVLVGLFDVGISAWILVVLGLLIGLLNISAKEVKSFLMASAVLVIVVALSKGALAPVGLDAVLDAILQIVVPATIIVALKEIFAVA